MKQLVIILLITLYACNDKTVEITSSGNITSKEESKVATSSEILSIQDKVKIVDYSGLAPLLAKRNDTTYVVNFWATWCRPCIKELPAFEELGAKYADKNVKVILVSLDFPDKLEQQVIPFIKKNDLKSEIILLDDTDANSWIPAIDKSWSGAIPATIIYNKAKRTFYERSFTYQELEKEVQSIL